MTDPHFSLDDRRFVGTQGNATGEVSSDTCFHYHESEGIIWAEYAGGSIVRGTLLGQRKSPNLIEFVYQQLNRAGELRTGQCASTIEALPDGRLRMLETWRWTSGEGGGTSIVEEVTSNQVGRATNSPSDDDYKARLRAHTEDKDFLAMQRQAPAQIAALVDEATEDELRRAPSAGKWSVTEIIAHLAEDELVSAWRYRQMIEHPGGTLAPFDQDLWARLADYSSWSVADALSLFRLLRAANVRLLEGLEPQQWNSHGMHPERGTITVRDLARHMAGHDVNHIAQIKQRVGTAPKT